MGISGDHHNNMWPTKISTGHAMEIYNCLGQLRQL